MCKPLCNSGRSDGIRTTRKPVPWHHTDIRGLRVKVERDIAPKGPLQCKRSERCGHTQRNCGYATRCVACGNAHPSGKSVIPNQQLNCCSCERNHTATHRGCSEWKDAKATTTKRAQGKGGRKDGVSTRLPAPKSTPGKTYREQEKLGPGWNQVVRGDRVFKAQATHNPISTSSDIRRRTERQATAMDIQGKPACPEVSLIESQQPRSKQTKSAPSSPQGSLR
jgi:hypothetical protein